jgi:hypothetical protein
VLFTIFCLLFRRSRNFWHISWLKKGNHPKGIATIISHKIVSLIRYIFFYILLLILIDWVTEQSLGGPGTAFINFYCISFFSSVNVVLKTSLFRPRLYINLTQMIKPVWYRERNIRRTVAIATVDKKKTLLSHKNAIYVLYVRNLAGKREISGCVVYVLIPMKTRNTDKWFLFL